MRTYQTTREVLDELESVEAERKKLATKLEEALIREGKKDGEFATLRREVEALRKREEDFTWFEEAARIITGYSSPKAAVGKLISDIRAKISGLEYKVANLEGDLRNAATSRDAHYDRLRNIKNLLIAAGVKLGWRDDSAEKWLRDELPALLSTANRFSQADAGQLKLLNDVVNTYLGGHKALLERLDAKVDFLNHYLHSRKNRLGTTVVEKNLITLIESFAKAFTETEEVLLSTQKALADSHEETDEFLKRIESAVKVLDGDLLVDVAVDGAAAEVVEAEIVIGDDDDILYDYEYEYNPETDFDE